MRNKSFSNCFARSWKLEGVEMIEGGESMRRMIIWEGNTIWDWLIMMTGPCDATEIGTSYDGDFRKCSNPGKDCV